MVTEPKLCLECGNFPCTCGKQYHDLSDKNLLILLDNLVKLARERHMDVSTSVNGQDIEFVVAGCKQDPYLFKRSEVDLMPDSWKDLISRHKTADGLYQQLCDRPSILPGVSSILAFLLIFKSKPTSEECISIFETFLTNSTVSYVEAIGKTLKSIPIAMDKFTSIHQAYNGATRIRLNVKPVSAEQEYAYNVLKAVFGVISCLISERNPITLVSLCRSLHTFLFTYYGIYDLINKQDTSADYLVEGAHNEDIDVVNEKFMNVVRQKVPVISTINLVE